jgi:hypothetical protein
VIRECRSFTERRQLGRARLRAKIDLPFPQLARNVSGVIGDVGFDDSVRAG